MESNFKLSLSDLSFSSTPELKVMNFLNEVAGEFPAAISFASGRPLEAFFDVSKWFDQIELFANHISSKSGLDPQVVTKQLGQYGRTKGIINDLVAESLRLDEKVTVTGDDIVITNGAQEAMVLILSGLFVKGVDVLLVTDPTYIGITGLASVFGIDIVVIESDDEGPRLDCLQSKCKHIYEAGKVAKALYVIPDFNNPMGHSMSLARREALLSVADGLSLMLIEDNPYGLFRFENTALPTLKSLDSKGIVIYIGTFSKTICPGLRVGYIATELWLDDNEKRRLSDELTKIKSLISVNTGQVAQAIVGGVLLEHNCSVKHLIAPNIIRYKKNRDLLLHYLEEEFISSGRFKTGEVSWNIPEGGFFIVIKLPISFNESETYECAQDYNVICMPLNFFSVNKQYDRYIRLSYSYIDEEEIAVGIRSLADFISKKLLAS
ncbi:aminotransferase-like domain-containing protein [Pseudoalteromonas luteoviolacea]|uniref:Aminotransferase class I/classII large domain-containing protein n=1 Tax=Pseudoalteromonas luteoviolacea H33 TaxID=1365251 RepID=A0A162A8R2_9GAMM|nr:PLP-dependent aminotransferase family protein [Pseudoalteromonas luteoviolacea]KZN45933.1 hypothetical protein N476_24650 [Pseudoalteromonas luteoviolacea H33]KZN71222.1 hypothetical protein N477_25670 [Pseudoalteromonas luteoviolacea H33-S]